MAETALRPLQHYHDFPLFVSVSHLLMETARQLDEFPEAVEGIKSAITLDRNILGEYVGLNCCDGEASGWMGSSKNAAGS